MDEGPSFDLIIFLKGWISKSEMKFGMLTSSCQWCKYNYINACILIKILIQMHVMYVACMRACKYVCVQGQHKAPPAELSFCWSFHVIVCSIQTNVTVYKVIDRGRWKWNKLYKSVDRICLSLVTLRSDASQVCTCQRVGVYHPLSRIK